MHRNPGADGLLGQARVDVVEVDSEVVAKPRTNWS
jgi:hypothetical protein